MSKLSSLAARLLAALKRRVTLLASRDLQNLPGDRQAAGRIRAETRDAQAGVVRLDLVALLGHEPDGAERKAAHRAIDQLAAAGLVERLVADTRTTHIRLLTRPE